MLIYNNGGYQLDLFIGWGGTPDWINTSSFVDSISPGDSLFVGVTFDALGYCEDQSGVLRIKSNDPDSQTIDIPLDMTVVASNHIATSVDILNWGVVGAITRPSIRDFDVQNLGCDGYPLTVSNIVMSDSSVFYVLTDTPFTVDPGESYEVDVGIPVGLPNDNYYGKLTIYSDDPDDPEIEVKLTATVEGTPLLQVSANANGDAVVVEPLQPLPLDLRACPNPFNPSTEIRFNLNKPGRVEIRIYDVTGALINVIDKGHCASGPVTVTWNGGNRRGNRVASGIYFYRLMVNGQQLGETKKLILLR